MKFNNEHSLYKKNGFIIIDNFLPDDLYKEIVDIFHKGEYEEIKQSINDRYE